MRRNIVVIQTRVYFLLPLIILLFPDGWILSWFIAATIHECFHIAAIRIFRVRILKIEIGILGAKIEAEPMHTATECICALVGPVGALSVLLFSRYIPRIALCVFAQSAYNLLPVYPLDGGRALRCILISRVKGEWAAFAEQVVLYGIIIACLFGTVFLKLGILPVLLCIGLFIRYRNANRPCKQRFYRVQ